eukprot:Platyproteum_vivax@DN14678_c0_g1_i1.p1
MLPVGKCGVCLEQSHEVYCPQCTAQMLSKRIRAPPKELDEWKRKVVKILENSALNSKTPRRRALKGSRRAELLAAKSSMERSVDALRQQNLKKADDLHRIKHKVERCERHVSARQERLETLRKEVDSMAAYQAKQNSVSLQEFFRDPSDACRVLDSFHKYRVLWGWMSSVQSERIRKCEQLLQSQLPLRKLSCMQATS